MAKPVQFKPKPAKSSTLAKHQALWGATNSKKGSSKKRGKGGGS